LVRLNRIVIFLPLVVIFSMIVNLPFVNSEEDVNMLFEKGKESYMAGNPEEAISYFEKVLQIEPNHVDALNNIGAILIILDKHEEAIPFFDKVLAIEPNHVGGLGNKGSALGFLGDFDEAMKYLDRALEIDPNHVSSLNNKASVLLDQENFYDAIPYFYKVLQIDPGNELATKNLPLVKQAIGYNIVDGFLEFILRDSQENLIGYYKTPYLLVLDHEIAQNFTDSWPVVREISFEGTNYEVIQRLYNGELGDLTFVASLRINDPRDVIQMITSPSWGFPIHLGDKITKLYTIFRPIE